MRPICSERSAIALAILMLSAVPAAAQPRPAQLPPQAAPQVQPPAPAPIKPYKALAITLPTPVNDPSFAAFRKQLADVASRKDRAALAKLTVAQGFFWEGENGDQADKKKAALGNLEQALGGFSGADAAGWDALVQAAADPTLEPLEGHTGVMCGPAGPQLDEKAFEALAQSTGTDPGEWAFTTVPNLDARGAAQPTAPSVEKLPLMVIRVLPDTQPQQPTTAPPNMQPPAFAHVALPSGKTAYVAMDGISPLGFDQLCYAKDASGWKIAGYESAN